MIYGELLELTRKVLDDQELPYLFKDEELLDCIQQTVWETLSLIHGVRVERDETLTALSQSIDLIEEASNVFAVTLQDGTPLRRALIDISRKLDRGTPRYFLVKDRKLWFYPIPEDDLSVTVVYKVTRVPEISLDDEVIVPDRLEQAVVYGAASRAYLRQDSEIYDPKQSERLYSRFLADVHRYKSETMVSEYVFTSTPIFKGLL